MPLWNLKEGGEGGLDKLTTSVRQHVLFELTTFDSKMSTDTFKKIVVTINDTSTIP